MYIRTIQAVVFKMKMIQHFILIFISFSVIIIVNGIPRLDPLVETKVGLIRGLRAMDGDYSMFLGIPYAEVNKNNPFGLSILHTGFDDTFNAFDDTAICPQMEEFNNTIVGTLDCLHLNIYVPNSASSKNRLPVLVWIYGGGFATGFAGSYLYGPKYLVRHNVILVTINYRLGPYGFMCLDTPEVPGNQGFKDQLLALTWINKNIESFGGDVNGITLFGHSAGGIAVDDFLQQDEKLFSRVIMQSGTSLLPRLEIEPNSLIPSRLSAELGFVTEDETEALHYLSKTDTNLVIAAGLKLEGRPFLPCIERNVNNNNKFLSDFSVNRDVSKSKNISILIGHTADESIVTLALKDEVYFESGNVFKEILIDGFNFDEQQLNMMDEILKHFYVGDEKMSKDAMFESTDYFSDVLYNHPAKRSIERYLKFGADSIYYYVFSYNGGRNFAKRKNNVTLARGPAHADEIGYLFDVSFYKENTPYDDQLIIDRITAMWTNFAKFGNPTPDITDLLPVNWVPVSKGSPLYYMDINSAMSIKTRPFKERMAFWDLFYDVNETYQKGFRNLTKN